MLDILHQKPLLGRQINWAHPLAKGLVACWVFNEGSGNKVYDVASRRYDLDFFNSPTWIPGRNGDAVFFVKGDSEYLEISSVTFAEPLTVMGWFRTDDTTSFGMIWCSAVAASTSERLMIQYRGDVGGDPLELNADGGVAAAAQTGNGFSSNVWHHFCGILAANNNRTIYLDADIANKGSDTGARGVYTPDRMAIGRECGSTPYYYDGSIDHVMIWNRVLTEDEVIWHYREPYAMFIVSVVARFEAKDLIYVAILVSTSEIPTLSAALLI